MHAGDRPQHGKYVCGRRIWQLSLLAHWSGSDAKKITELHAVRALRGSHWSFEIEIVQIIERRAQPRKDRWRKIFTALVLSTIRSFLLVEMIHEMFALPKSRRAEARRDRILAQLISVRRRRFYSSRANHAHHVNYPRVN